MKGVILAGGKGLRLLPLTRGINKHLLPVGRYPMLYHSVYKLKEVGINEILIITSPESSGDIIKALGSGKEHGVDITYKVQDEPNGVAGAVSLAKSYINNHCFVLLLGDNLFEDSLENVIKQYKATSAGGLVCLKEVTSPQQFGIAELSKGCIINIEEKPINPKTNLCVTGIYIYDPQVFTYIQKLRPTDRGELEISDLNKMYINDQNLSHYFLNGWWMDVGTIDSYIEINHLLKNAYDM